MRHVNLHRLGLAALLLWVAGSSLWIILADNQPIWADPTTNMVPSVMLRDLLLGQGEVTWARWLTSTTERLWLSSLVHLPFMLLIPEPLQALRVAELCLMLGVLWGVYGLGCRLGGRSAGLLAATLLAATPYFLSWGRAGNADPIIWASMLLLFSALLDLDLRSPRHAMRMGIFAGLAAASRLFVLVHLSAAALWVLAFAVRSRRAAINLVPAALVSFILPGWWVAARWGAVSEAASRSSGRPNETAYDALTVYLGSGLGVIVLVAMAALALAFYRRLLPRRQLSLFAIMIFIPALQLVVQWDIWGRYMVSLMPLCALIVAVTAARLSASWRLPWRLALGGMLLLALGFNWLLIHQGRISPEGLNHPDSRPYLALGRIMALVPPKARVLVKHSVFDDQYAFCLNLRQPPHLRRRLHAIHLKDGTWNLPGDAQAHFMLRVQVDLEIAKTWLKPPIRGLTSIEIAAMPFEDSFPGLKDKFGDRLQRLARHDDPNGVFFTLYKVWPPITASEF